VRYHNYVSSLIILSKFSMASEGCISMLAQARV
jgi:hypothetical protein